MRGLWTMVTAAMLLTGCGVQVAPTAYGQLASTAAAQAKSAAAPFFSLFPAEPMGHTEVYRAIEAFVAAERPSLPLGPNGEVEKVTGVLVQELAARHIAGGRKEFVGKGDFQGTHVPNTYITHEKLLPFKLVLDARGKLVSFDFERVSLSGVTIVRPDFKAVSAAEAARVEADVLAFLETDSIAHSGDGDTLFKALLGEASSYTAKIEGVKATPGAFGEWGRAFELEVPFRNHAGGIFYTYTVHALVGKDGKLAQVR